MKRGISISSRAMLTPASPIRRLIPYAEKAAQSGKEIYHLNIGQPDIETPSIYYEYVNNFKPRVVSYSHSAGILELRESFCEYYKRFGIGVKPEEIIVTNGGSEAVMFAMAVVADPGDEILVVEPFYANYGGFAAQLGIKLVPVTTHPEEGYSIPSKEAFESKISARTKAIIFSNPCNPTGAVYDHVQLETIANVAFENDLFVISDEVYREFTFDGLKAISMMHFEKISDRVIMTDSISKRYSACGARIGTFVTKNPEIYSNVMKFAQARLCPSLLSQYGTLGLLKLDSQYSMTVRKEYQARRDVVYEELQKIQGAVFEKPRGAFYVSVKLPIHNSEEFVKWMLTDFEIDGKTTMVAPLDGFYATPQGGLNEVRIAYVLEKEKLRDAVRILKAGIELFNSK